MWSLLLCSSPAIKGFGIIVGIGIGFGFVLTLTFLPALLMLLAPKVEVIAEGSERPSSLLTEVVTLGKRYDRPIFWGCSLLAVATLALLPLNESDFNRLDFLGALNLCL